MGLKHVKSFRSHGGELEMDCENDRFAETRFCRIRFVRGASPGNVILNPAAPSVAVIFSGPERGADFRSAFVETAPVLFSPDEHLVLCVECYGDGGEAWLSWTTENK